MEANLGTYHGYKHGLSRTPEYRSWISMIKRCRDPKEIGYKYYGGKGIVVCERWLDFLCFLEDMGERPSMAHTLDRRDPNRNYEPGNCRWATKTEQQHNRRDTILVPADVVEIRALRSSGMTKAAIGARFGISETSVFNICAKQTWKDVA